MAIKVLLVDDSVTVRKILTEILSSDNRLEVVGEAGDAYEARDMIVRLKPDVVCLDINMPKMDGITFLKKLMQYFPTPVVMVSSLTKKSAIITIEALENGAVDYMQKPTSFSFDKKDHSASELINKVIAASRSKVKKLEAPVSVIKTDLLKVTNKIILIGSSTGGVDALKAVLTQMPQSSPPILIVQHMPEAFVPSLAQRFDKICEMHVKVAQNKEEIRRGVAYIAPGSYHMVVRQLGGKYFIEIGQGDKVNGHCPSVDVLFNSAAKTIKNKAVGVILTGMGNDGAKGMLNIHNTGAKTIAQSEKTCVVYGMPKEAVALNAVDDIVDLEKIPQAIIKVL